MPRGRQPEGESTLTAVQQHKLEIAAADREHQIPPDRPQDHLGSELPPFEGSDPRVPGSLVDVLSCHRVYPTRSAAQS